jgi:single-strand DNA-binding protein
MINQIVLIGNLTEDVRMNKVNESTIANFRIAVNDKRDKEKTLFINVTAFNKLAELVGEHLTKGSKVAVVGRLQIRQVEDKQYTEVIANEVEFLSPREVTPYDFT